MGTFTVLMEVDEPVRGEFIRVEAPVDTGPTHTLLPRDTLAALGFKAKELLDFQLIDERTVQYGVGEVRVRLDGRERTTLVVFGPEGGSALLGATTLEFFNQAADPVQGRLVPVPGLPKSATRLAFHPT